MNKEKTVKKKRSHFFEIYILKVLAQISEHSSITSNAKQQLNSVLCILARHISKIALDLTIFAKKKTITEKEVGNALKIILLGELLNNSISEGEKAVINYKNYSDDTHSEQNKLNIITEYIQGETLFDYISGQQFDINEFIFILIQVCFALKVAQNRCGFVHYDLTPWNIILARLPNPVQFDYLISYNEIYRVNTTVIPVIIDYGKSHVIHNGMHYGLINMFNSIKVL